MRNRYRSLVVGWICLLGAGCRPNPQESFARTLEPAQLTLKGAGPTGRGATRTFRVRVYAANEYRVQVSDWQRRFRGQLQRINQLLDATYGTRLVAAELRPWPRDTAATTMDQLLDDLARHDPGDGVDWVIGLVAAQPVFESSLHKLGMARVLGRHFVIRNLNDVAEYQALGRVLDELPREQRDNLFARRKEHKELTVFLHEWGHTLGAMHIFEDRSLMNPTYADDQTDFSPANAAIVEIGLAHRATAGGDPEWRKKMLQALHDYLAVTDDRDWERSSRAEMLALVGLAAQPVMAQGAAPEGDATAIARARAESDASDYAGGWATLAPVVERHADDARTQLLACHLAVRARADLATERRLCDRAAALTPARPEALIFLSGALMEAGNGAEARAALARARALVESAPAAGKPDWWSLGHACHKALLPSLGQAAVAHLAEPRHEADWIEPMRRRYGVPVGAATLGLAAEDEGEYIDLQEALAPTADEARVRAAVTRLRAGFPRLPGASLAECRAKELDHDRGAARTACHEAIARHKEYVMPHLVLGRLALAAGDKAGALAEYEAAFALDPSAKDTWQLLASLYKATRKTAKLKQLREWYEDRFHAPLET